MDPEVVKRLRQDIAGGDFDSAGHVADLRALIADWERQGEALRRVLTEAGIQAHKHGCPNRLLTKAQWDEFAPCAGCEAEAVLVAKEG